MATKSDLMSWILEALREKGGAAHHVQVAKYVWTHHASELQASGDLLYTWQYDLRWAALKLRKSGVMKPDSETRRGEWVLDDMGERLGKSE